MFKSSFIVLLVFIQLTILLLTLNYYLIPKTLSSHCVSSEAFSKQLGKGMVVDCIACYQQQKQLLGSRELSSISILIPSSLKHQNNLNLNESFQFVPGLQKNALKQQFLYSGAAFYQEECQQFQCSALYQPKDFSLNQNSKDIVTSRWNKVESFNLKQSSILGSQFLNSNFTTEKYKMLSAALLNQPKQHSMALRFRYNVVPGVDPQFQPVFILYSNENSVFIRLLLLAPLLLSLHKILCSLFSLYPFAKYLLYIVFFSGILSQNLLIVTASLSIYLTIGQMIGKRFLGFFLSLLYFVVAIVLNYQVVSLLVLCLVTFFVVSVMFGIQQKNRQNYQNVAIFVIFSFNILMAFVLSWSTLAIVSVCQFLACFTPSSDHKTESKSSYSGVHNHELEEQQDMVVKIQRQLGHH